MIRNGGLLLLAAGLMAAGCLPDDSSPATAATASKSAAPAIIGQQAAQVPVLGRGINLGNSLELPSEGAGAGGFVLQASFFQAIHAAGFRTIRVPMRWSAHAGTQAPYALDPAFLDRIDWVVAQAHANHLNAILDFHGFDEIYDDAAGQADRFVGIWQAIAHHFHGEDSSVLYELLNEPHGKLDAATWNALLARGLAAIRTEDPTRTVIVGGISWSSASGLSALRLPADSHLLATFHLYTPMLFTHQGAGWVGPEYGTQGVHWPGPPDTPVQPASAALSVDWVRQWFADYNTLGADQNPAGPAPVSHDLDLAASWSKQNGVPVYLGEFGAYQNADMASRERWTAFVRAQAEARGMAWAYWEFGAGFGAYDRAKGQWRPELLGALMPTPP